MLHAIFCEELTEIQPISPKDKMSYTANFMSKGTQFPQIGKRTDQVTMKLLWFILFEFVLFKFVSGKIDENVDKINRPKKI